MNWISDVFSKSLMEALGWTILHSLWQSAAVALLLALALIVMRKNSSQVRYFVSVTALFTLFIVSLATFGSIYFQNSGSNHSDSALWRDTPEEKAKQVIILTTSEVVPQSNFFKAQIHRFSAYFSEHLPFIVSAWLLGVMILTLRFLGGFAYIQRLKHYKTYPVSEYWEGTLRYLAAQIRVRKSVRLLESALVQVPMVVGYFKPVILLPLGALTGMSQHQVESILAHELAHIRRHDYLVNFIQSFLEILFFFNPFIWWISSKIREERENCCDDIAVEIIGDQLTFIKTLATLEEMRLQSAQFALGFAGSHKLSLLNRVNRLLKERNQSSTFSEGFTSAVVLFCCLALASINANANYNWPLNKGMSLLSELTGATEESPETPEPEENLAPLAWESEPDLVADITPPAYVEDTIRFGKGFMLVTEPSGKFTIFKDGKVIPPESYDQYAKDFEVKDASVTLSPKSDNQVVITLDKDKEKFKYKGGKSVVIVNPGEEPIRIEIPPIPPIPLTNFEFHLDSLDNEITIDLDEDRNYNYKFDIENDGNDVVLRLNGNNIFSQKAWEAWGEQMGKWGEAFGKQFEVQVGKMEVIKEKMKEVNEKMEKEIKVKVKTEMAKFRAKFEPIKQEMIKDGLLDKNDKSVSMTINRSIIKVNGKTLNEAQQKKYKELFKKHLDIDFGKGTHWFWSFSDDED